MLSNRLSGDMSAETYADPTWTDTEACPFCQDELTDAGAGFIDHIESSPECATGFECWRGRVADDMTGGWSG
jgi:hypothetical protein